MEEIRVSMWIKRKQRCDKYHSFNFLKLREQMKIRVTETADTFIIQQYNSKIWFLSKEIQTQILFSEFLKMLLANGSRNIVILFRSTI